MTEGQKTKGKDREGEAIISIGPKLRRCLKMSATIDPKQNLDFNEL